MRNVRRWCASRSTARSAACPTSDAGRLRARPGGTPRSHRHETARLVSTLRVLVAPDSYKGSMSSVVVAAGLADGWTRGRPMDTITLSPLADGGEGTLDAILAAGGWVPLPAAARDPLMRPVDARFLRQGGRAAVELASASGLSLVPRSERDAGAATTF